MAEWKEYEHEDECGSIKEFGFFDHDGLANSGTLVEVKNKDGEIKQFLIGGINEKGGDCDNSCGIDFEDEVLRYKVVHEKEENDEGWTACKKNFNFGNFVDSELNIPGILIEVFQFDTVFNMTLWESVKLKDKAKVIKHYLIGDVNETGGSDDHCMGVDNGDKVLRYKVVWKKEK